MTQTASVTRTTREEMETTISFNRSSGQAECCTADPSVARRWVRAGWPVEVLGRYRDGKVRTWQATVPWRRAVTIKRMGVLAENIGVDRYTAVGLAPGKGLGRPFPKKRVKLGTSGGS